MFASETRILADWTLARLRWLDAAFAAVADPAAAPTAYLKVGYVVAEPPVAGPSSGAGGSGGGAGPPAVAGR